MFTINTNQTPAAIGPYSQAIKAGNFLFISGQIALTKTGVFLGDATIQEQTKQVFVNLKAILKEAKMELTDIAKCSVFISDINNFTKVNEIYAKEFGDHKPARECIQAVLPKNALVEISAIAYKEDNE